MSRSKHLRRTIKAFKHLPEGASDARRARIANEIESVLDKGTDNEKRVTEQANKIVKTLG